VALAVLTIAATTAQAGLFNFNYTGSFNSTTTLGGVALGADTPFSIVATFDSSVNYGFFNTLGYGVYPVTALSLSLSGNTYTAIPDSNTTVIFWDDLNTPPSFAAGLYYNTTGGTSLKAFNDYFSTQSNSSFDPTAPSANTYSTPTVGAGFAQDYSLSLVGVTGGLANMGFGTTDATASISAAAVPEPAEYAAVTGLALGVFALVQRRRQAAGR
jgi:hypothetical protein